MYSFEDVPANVKLFKNITAEFMQINNIYNLI
jgi:hypothetical protein